MIKFIFFDLDNTLLDFTRAEGIAIRKTLKALTLRDVGDDVVALYRRINSECWRAIDRGEADRERVFSLRFERLFEEMGIHPSVQMARNLYDRHLSTGHYFIEGAPMLLSTLSRTYSLYLASNGRRVIQEGRLESSGIKPFFKEIFLSEDLGYHKPDRAFFDACFSHIENFDPSCAIMCGDNPIADIGGAKSAGMITCHFNPNGMDTGEIVPDYTISHLSDFLAVLKDCNAKK